MSSRYDMAIAAVVICKSVAQIQGSQSSDTGKINNLHA